MADLLERWAARLDTVNAAVGLTVRWVAVGMLVIQFASVVLRYVFGTSEIFVQESVLYLHAALLMLGAGYTLAVEGHVRVDIFYGEASPRRKAAVDLIGTLVFLVPACVAILRYSWPSMIRSWQILEGPISVGGIPASFVLKSLIPAFAALLLVQGAALALRSAAVLAAGTTRESGAP